MSPSKSSAQRRARVVLGGALLLLGLWTLRGFLLALVWATVFAIAAWPFYKHVRRYWPAPRLDILLPGMFTVAFGLLFIVPLMIAAAELSREMHVALEWIRAVERDGVPIPTWVAALPIGGTAVADWWNRTLSDPAGTSAWLSRLNQVDILSIGRRFGSQLVHRLVQFCFTLLTLFFLLRHGRQLSEQLLLAADRLFGPAGERIGRQAIASVHVTVNGLVLVGLGVGTLLGMAYAVAGLSHPVLLGTVTAVAAMVPFGAPIIFGAVALWLLMQGALEGAAGVFAFGMVVTSLADHVVRPAVIGGATRLPFLWVLLGILGGLENWGLLGLFLGPAIMAVLMLLWRDLLGEQ